MACLYLGVRISSSRLYGFHDKHRCHERNANMQFQHCFLWLRTVESPQFWDGLPRVRLTFACNVRVEV